METRGNTIRIPRGKYTAKIVAEMVGKSQDTIVRWRRDGLLPYEVMDAGTTQVYLFDKKAVLVARGLAAERGKLINRAAA